MKAIVSAAMVAAITSVFSMSFADSGPDSGTRSGTGPSATELQKVFSYYDSMTPGQAVLVDYKICQDIHRSGIDKNNCNTEIGPKGVEANTSAYVWLQLMVPAHTGPGNLLLQFDHNGVTRKVKTLPISGAFRYRTWAKIKLDRPGGWSIRVLQDGSDGVSTLGDIPLTIANASSQTVKLENRDDKVE